MNKKILYLIIFILILSILIIVLLVNKKSQVISDGKNDLNNPSSVSGGNDADFFQIIYNDIENVYNIVDSRNGETILSLQTEEEAKMELDFYKEHPNYFATPPNLPDSDLE